MGEEKIYCVIGRGFGGWHAHGINCSSSGGSLDPYTYWTGELCSGYRQRAVEGALVYDAAHLEDTPAARAAFYALVIQGPMVDTALPPHGVRRFSEGERACARSMLPGLGGAFVPLARRAVADRAFGGLDTVGIAIYRRLLAEVPGIRLGHIEGEEVVWEVDARIAADLRRATLEAEEEER